MNANIASLLRRAGLAWPRLPAVGHGVAVVADFATLAARAAALAGGLAEAGFAPGERIALVMKNVPEYVELLFGIWHAGLVAVPINAKLHPRELEFILADTAARACFVTPELADGVVQAVRASSAACRVIDVAGAEFRRLAAGEKSAVAGRRADDLAWLFYTSGTTGRPKGVMLTHGNLLAATQAYFSDVDAIDPGDALLHAAPMSHGSGFYILSHVARGACNVVPESGGFDPAEICGLLPHWRGVSMFAAPTMVKRLVGHAEAHAPDLANLKTVIYGGGPMYVADIRRAIAVMGNRFAQIFGQGESPMTITAASKAMHRDADDALLASVGLPFLGVEVRVADADDNPLPTGEVGEVLVRGPTVMAGYLNNPEATARTLRNGWLHTGDMGSLDARGLLTLKDRSKDLIISGGSNIYPREVEEVLLTHPSVAEVSVVGLPDAEWGEIVIAVVVPRGDADAVALDAHCLAHIARFKRPKRYLFVDALPKNATGKILKTELRSMLAAC